jgi:glycosyltransferase involved in cell wall biosynthesis
MVHIVLPVYNGARFLPQCLESIREQTYSLWELIIVNDGSTDDSDTIIQHFIQTSSNPVVYLKLEQNKGIAYGLNLGIQHAKGSYIARIDADDIMLKERLAVQVKFLEEHPNIDILGSDAIEIDDLGRKISYLKTLTEDAMIKKELIGRCSMLHPTIMFRAKVFDHKIFYRDLYPVSEDRDLWLRLMPFVHFCNQPLPLILRRTHSNQVTMSKKVYVDTFRLTRHYLLEHKMLLKYGHYLIKPLIITLLPNYFYTAIRNFKKGLRQKSIIKTKNET